MSWIKKQLIKFDSQERQTIREFVSGENHYFEGHRYLLNVIFQKSTPKVVIRNKTYLDLYVRQNSTREQRERVLTKWYRQELKKKIPSLIEKWQEIIGIKINDWEVKRMKTKWGTCKIESQG